jgi:hypothetical protein
LTEPWNGFGNIWFNIWQASMRLRAFHNSCTRELRIFVRLVKVFDSPTMFNLHYKPVALFIFGCLMGVGSVRGKDAGQPAVSAGDNTPKQAFPSQTVNRPHKFLDAENLGLFAGVAVTRALDFTSTQHFRERGHNEILLTNQIVDNKPLFAGIEAAGTAASIGIAYWLHHSGHHRAERWVSIVHIGVGTVGDIHNYDLSRPQLTGTVP